MRKLLAVLILLMPSFALAGTCGSGYLFTRQIKVMKASGSDLTNYPMLISSRDASPAFKGYMKTVANGGQIQNTANNSKSISGPADLVFCDAASSGNALKYEVVTYGDSSGIFEIWVQIPTLHTASNDSIYMFANNSSVSTSQQDLSLWTDANYSIVCHEPDGSSLNPYCSVGGTGSNTGSGNAAVTGKVDGAVSFNGSGGIDTGQAVTLTAMTLEAWVKRGSNSTYTGIIANNPGTDTAEEMAVENATDGSQPFCYAGTSSTNTFRTAQVALDDSTWHYVACTASGNTQNMLIYVDMSTATSATHNAATSFPAVVANFHIGEIGNNTQRLTGSIDEVRVATDAKSANWLQTTYNAESGFQSTYQVVESSYSAPTIAQYISCATTDMTSGSFSCVLPFAVTSGGVMAYALGQTDSSCSNTPTDGLGLTLTQQVIADFTGTVQHYYNCAYTAPITATGSDTVTSPTGNYTAVVYELKGVTATGIATAGISNTSPVGALTATCGGATCFLLCSENLTNSAGFIDTYGNSEGYTEIISPEALPSSNTHKAQTYSAYGVVSSGSRTCTVTGTGQAGTMMLLPVSATTATKRRPSQVY